MGTDDAADAALAVLARYFSGPIAQALLAVARRREGLEGTPLTQTALARAVAALERALPSYMADPARRRRCVDDLRALVPDAEPISIAPSDRSPATPKAIAVVRPEHLMAAAEAARSFGRSAGFGALDQTKVATAVAELTRNMLQYAGGGEVRFALLTTPRHGLEVTAVDRGTGIADIELVMSAAYKSRTGMGLGLKGVKRIVDDLEIQSSRAGTRVVFRKYI